MAHAFVEVPPSSLLVFLILDSMGATARARLSRVDDKTLRGSKTSSDGKAALHLVPV